MAVYETVYEYYLHQLRNCESYIEQCKVHAEPELVHQLRLSIKKLRAFSKLATRLDLPGTEDYRQLIEGVKKLFKLAGQIRDTQVQIYMLADCKEQTGVSYTLFHSWLLRREKTKISQLCKNKYKSTYEVNSGSTGNSMDSKISHPDTARVFSIATLLLDEMYQSAQKLATGNIKDEHLHDIRKIAKQMRYILTILTGIYPDFQFQRITLEALKGIENAVGNWHDNLVRIEFINRFLRKIKNQNEVILLKYNGLTIFGLASLNEAYENACLEVKTKLLE